MHYLKYSQVLEEIEKKKQNTYGWVNIQTILNIFVANKIVFVAKTSLKQAIWLYNRLKINT